MDSLHILYRSQNLKQHKAVLIYFIRLIAFLSSEQHNEKTRNSIALNLYRCFNISDKSLEYIKNLSELKHLNLAGCYKITDNGLGNLKGLQSLMSLNLATCTLLTDTGLGFLKDLHNLNDLKLPDFKLN